MTSATPNEPGNEMRLPPPGPSSLDRTTAELLELATAPSGETAETVAVLAHNPALVGPFLEWAMTLHTRGVLSKRLHEIVALRVAHRCGSVYEWDEHVGWARDAGLSEVEIQAVASGPSGWSTIEAAAIEAVDELHVSQDLTDRTMAMLVDELGEAAVVELIVVAGQYTMLSMLATATGSAARRVPNP